MLPSAGHFWKAVDDIDSAALLHVDLDGRILYANAGVERVLGYQPDALLTSSISALLPRAVRDNHQSMFDRYASRRRQGQAEVSPILGVSRRFIGGTQETLHQGLRFAARHASGRTVPVALTVNEVRDDEGQLVGFLALLMDWSAELALQEKLRRKDIFDERTGLLCMKGLRSVIQSPMRNATELEPCCGYALLHIDIDHFSALAMASFLVADNAIKSFATWLQVCVQRQFGARQALVAKHFNAAEFLVYLNAANKEQAVDLARSLRERLGRINLGPASDPFHTTLSIGIVVIQAGGNLEYGLSRAAHACYLARTRGHDRVVVARERDLRIYELGQSIRQALRGGRLEVYAQKIIELDHESAPQPNRLLYFEVLCRLRDQDGLYLSADEIFPAAEQLGLAWPLDEAITRATLGVLASCPEQLLSVGLCSINLSAVSVANDRALPSLSALIVESGIPPDRLCFEVTESAAVHDSQVALATLKGLRALGCRIAIDDFGSGYSNYHSLTGWPVDIVKIDGEYVRALLSDHSMHVDVQGMIASARARGMKVVAEYAESADIVKALMRLGVDFAQGFEFHRPEPLVQLLGRRGAEE